MKQLTIAQFQNLYAASLKKYADETDRTVSLVAAYCGISFEVAECMQRDKFAKYAAETGQILNNLPKPLHALSIWIGCVKYRLIISPQSSTVAHQRLLEYCQSEENGGIVKNMHLALAALSEPGKLFGFLPIKETDQQRADKFQQRMPFNRAYGYLLFFCDLLPALSKAISLEVNRQARKMKRMNWKKADSAK